MEKSMVVGGSRQAQAAEEHPHEDNSFVHAFSPNLFVSAQTSFASSWQSSFASSWQSFSTLADAVTIRSYFTLGRHIGAPEIEEIPDHQWLPLSISRRVPAQRAGLANIFGSSHSGAPATGPNTNGNTGQWNTQQSVGPFRLFSSKEIRKATSNFNKSQIIRGGPFSELYKGTMPQFQQPVAIGRSRIDVMVNAIPILSRINHRNFIRLLGVCLESKEHVYSVYEYCPNGTLFENLKNGRMPWEIRLTVATEIAGALMYLHSLLSDPLIHGDITSSSIYLDANYTTKIFYTPGYIPGDSDKTHVMGTVGYQDPEFMTSHLLTCKSDVFAFGVILVELLTGKPPLYYTEGEKPIWLGSVFNSSLRESTLEQIFDGDVANEDTLNEMKLVASVAAKCLEPKSDDRLSIAEVAMALEQLKTPKSSHLLNNPVMQNLHDIVGSAQTINSDSWSTQPVSNTSTDIFSKFLNWMRNKQKQKFLSFINDSFKDSLKMYKIYSMYELQLATNNFDDSRILSKGKTIVHRGQLPDGKLCAIKQAINDDSAEEILNEVNFISQLMHKNILELLGFCIEAKYPTIVVKYMENGSLSGHIQRSSIPWEMRLKFSVEIARAISYLHNSLSHPIIHGDVKASNILIDDDYTAKLCDFGASSLLRVDIKSPSPLCGTPGYIDPEYVSSGHITCESDVYSFGVVLIELLTGKKAIFSENDKARKKLAEHFKWFMENNAMEHIIDGNITNETFSGQIKVVAHLALKCLSWTKEERPSMKEVTMKLELIQSGRLNTKNTFDTTSWSTMV